MKTLVIINPNRDEDTPHNVTINWWPTFSTWKVVRVKVMDDGIHKLKDRNNQPVYVTKWDVINVIWYML